MLFYTHPLNDRRAARGLASINGFWISGTGAWDGQALPAPRVAAGLRAPALRGDLTRWAEAWVQLEQDEITPLLEAAEGGAAVRLTLCGERSAISWASGLPAKPGALSRLRGLFQRQRPLDLTQLLSQL
jgi:hypothetical protein